VRYRWLARRNLKEAYESAQTSAEHSRVGNKEQSDEAAKNHQTVNFKQDAVRVRYGTREFDVAYAALCFSHLSEAGRSVSQPWCRRCAREELSLSRTTDVQGGRWYQLVRPMSWVTRSCIKRWYSGGVAITYRDQNCPAMLRRAVSKRSSLM